MIIDLVTYADSDFIQKYEYRTIGNVPIDLTLFGLRMIVRVNPDDAATQIDCSTLNGRIVITNPMEGAFTLTIPYEILSGLPPGNYVQSLIMTDIQDPTFPFGFPSLPFFSRKNIWRGTFTHLPGPSRWKIGTFE